MSLSIFFSSCLLVTVCISVMFDISHAWTEAATLTTTQRTSPIGSVSIVDHRDGNYNNINIDDSTFECNNVNSNSFCVELNIYNTQCNGGKETIEITVYGEGITGDVDSMALIAVRNTNNNNTFDYLSIASDWNFNGLSVGIDTNGGVFTAPHCSSNNPLNIETTDIVYDLFDGISSTSGGKLKRALGGGVSDNWEILTTNRVGENTSPIKYTIINDYNSNQLTTLFDASTLYSSAQCIRDTPFDTINGLNDYVIAFGTDNGIIKFSQFDVKVTCEEPTTGCLYLGESLCEQFYETKCESCDDYIDYTSEDVENCAIDMCENSECESLILEGGFTLDAAISTGCLETAVNKCFESAYNSLLRKYQQLGY